MKESKGDSLVHCKFNEAQGAPTNQHEPFYEFDDDNDEELDIYEVYIGEGDVFTNNFNEIRVYVGSNDMKNAERALIEEAFVMETLKNEATDEHPSLLLGFDIGLITMAEGLETKVPEFTPLHLPTK